MASRREEQSSKAARLDRDNPPTRERIGNKARIARRSRATPAPELPKEMPTGGVAGGNLKGNGSGVPSRASFAMMAPRRAAWLPSIVNEPSKSSERSPDGSTAEAGGSSRTGP